MISGPFSWILPNLTSASCLFDHLIKSEVDIERRSKYQFIPVGVEDRQLAHIPWLVQWTRHDVRASGVCLLGKGIHAALEALQHLEAQRDARASRLGDRLAVPRQRDQEVGIFGPAQMDKGGLPAGAGHRENVFETQGPRVEL